MRDRNSQFKYRSVKYSTSSLALARTSTEASELHARPRLAQLKENRPPSTQHTRSHLATPKAARGMPVDSRWSSNRITSAYKLRGVANSSHLRIRASEGEDLEEARARREQAEVEIVAVEDTPPPYFSSYCLLLEVMQGLEPQLEQQRVEAIRIREGLSAMRGRVEASLRESQELLGAELGKLRAQMGLAFKEHSRQAINVRETVSSLRCDLRQLHQDLRSSEARLSSNDALLDA